MYKDLTPLIPELRKSMPFFLPRKVKDTIINMMFFVLSL